MFSHMELSDLRDEGGALTRVSAATNSILQNL